MRCGGPCRAGSCDVARSMPSDRVGWAAVDGVAEGDAIGGDDELADLSVVLGGASLEDGYGAADARAIAKVLPEHDIVGEGRDAVVGAPVDREQRGEPGRHKD